MMNIWILKNRQEAINLGRTFMDKGLFYHVVFEHTFKDESLFYRMNESFDTEFLIGFSKDFNKELLKFEEEKNNKNNNEIDEEKNVDKIDEENKENEKEDNKDEDEKNKIEEIEMKKLDLEPFDEFNKKLLENVHPLSWKNPKRHDKFVYNLGFF
jgi:hypothetical protein